MSRHGLIVFGDLLGNLATLHVTCDKCGLKRRYAVKRLIEDHGRDGKVTDWLAAIAADGLGNEPLKLGQLGIGQKA